MARRKDLAQAAAKAYQKAKATSEPGEGSRFKALTKAVSARGGVKNPEAVSAGIMWKKYGKKGGAELIKKGKAQAGGKK